MGVAIFIQVHVDSYLADMQSLERCWNPGSGLLLACKESIQSKVHLQSEGSRPEQAEEVDASPLHCAQHFSES